MNTQHTHTHTKVLSIDSEPFLPKLAEIFRLVHIKHAWDHPEIEQRPQQTTATQVATGNPPLPYLFFF